eukprot:Em0006g23a
MFAPDRKITVRISGDGAKFSRSSSFTLLSYAILVPSERYPTGPVVKGGEDYETISQATFAEINHLQHMGYVTVNGVRFQIELFLSSDMKFMHMVLSLNGANSTYACPFCEVNVHRDHRWNMAKPETEYINTVAHIEK